jgi:MFS family permease
MVPALSGAVRRSDGPWMAVGIVLLSLALGLVPGPLLASTLAEILHPQTLVMATAAVAAACWALAASGPSWPVLAVVSLLGGAAASTFAFDTWHYWSALAGGEARGPNTASIAYLAAGVGVVFGLAVAVLVGPRVVEAVSAISMAVLCLAALIMPGLRHHPFESGPTGPQQV